VSAQPELAELYQATKAFLELHGKRELTAQECRDVYQRLLAAMKGAKESLGGVCK
jgi:hypothetical protein